MTDFNSNLNNLFNNFQKQQQYNKKKFDVNGDGKINSKDATTLNTEKSKLLKEKNLFDVNGDGLFSQNDVDMFIKGDVDGNGDITQEELNFISKFKTNFKSALVKEKSSFEMDGIKYVQGKLASGVVDGKYYLSGKPATGTNKGVYYVKGEPAQGIVNGKTYNDGVQVKELDKVTNSMVSAQKALTTAQTNFDNVEKTLNKTKTELNKLKEARNNYESLVQKNPKNKTYKNNLASINSQINTKLNQIRNYEKQKAAKQTALDNAKIKADAAQSNYINEQITLIEQGKMNKLNGIDGKPANGIINETNYVDGVPFNGQKDGLTYLNGKAVAPVSDGEKGSAKQIGELLFSNFYQNGSPSGMLTNIQYDDHGRVSSFKQFNATAIYDYYYTINYNEDESISIEKKETDLKRKLLQKTEIKYDSDGKITEKSMFDANNKLTSKETKTYDDKGEVKTSSTENYDKYGNIESKVEYRKYERYHTYMGKKYLSQASTYNEFYVRSEDGNLYKSRIEENCTFGNGDKHFIVRTLSPNGMAIQDSDTRLDDNTTSTNYYYYTDPNTQHTTLEYGYKNVVTDATGRKLQETKFPPPDGQQHQIITNIYTYNDDGSYSITAQDNYPVGDVLSVTKYDTNGNLISDEPVVGTIEYYEKLLNRDFGEITDIMQDSNGSVVSFKTTEGLYNVSYPGCVEIKFTSADGRTISTQSYTATEKKISSSYEEYNPTTGILHRSGESQYDIYGNTTLNVHRRYNSRGELFQTYTTESAYKYSDSGQILAVNENSYYEDNLNMIHNKIFNYDENGHLVSLYEEAEEVGEGGGKYKLTIIYDKDGNEIKRDYRE